MTRKTSKSLQRWWNNLSIHRNLQKKKKELKLINIGIKQDKRELKIGILITANMRNELVAFYKNMLIFLPGHMLICLV
jgi:hypothetical protein